MMMETNCLFSQSKIEPDPLPILAWHGIPADQLTHSRFVELREAGFTHNFSFLSKAEEVAKALDLAAKTDVKMIITCEELQSEPEKTVRRFMNHPALAGYFLRDEPAVKDFAELGAWAKRIKAVDSNHFCYLNLFPNGPKEHLDGIGAKSYADYVNQFDEQVPLSFLSFDHYPITTGGLKAEWYENLEDIARISTERNKDFWAFALATRHLTYPLPTLAMLRLQMYSNLAYGAQGLQYFTYSTPEDSRIWDFQDGIIGLDGKRTVVYDLVKALNQELQAVSGVFKDAKVISVRHTGDIIPRGTLRLNQAPAPIKVLATEGKGAVVSHLKKGKRQFLVIVNRDYESPMKLTLVADPSLKRVMKDGTLISADVYTPITMVDPGDAMIYCWEN